MNTNAIENVLGARFARVAADGALALKELRLPLDAAVLDVGTGSGNFAIFLASQGYQVQTGEPSTDRSHYAGQDWAANAEKTGLLDRIRFEHFDSSQLPFESAAFDAVFFFGVLHHVNEDLRSPALREAFRVLKPHGAVVIFEPRMVMLEKLWIDDPTHPLAANPSTYLPDPDGIEELRIEGAWMDIFVYRQWLPASGGSPQARADVTASTAR